MEIKYCNKCKETKPVSEFNKKCTYKDGLHSNCKSCRKQYREKNKDSILIRQKEWRENNKDNIKEYRENNRDSISIKKKEYLEKNRDSISIKKKEHYEKNKDSILIKNYEYRKHRMSIDPIFKFKQNMSSSIGKAFRNKNYTKSSKTCEILGCDWNTLKEYFESQFNENMSWENQGTYWDIDHIIPLATAKTEEDVIKLNHYTNLQPLESYYNRYIKRHLILD